LATFCSNLKKQRAIRIRRVLRLLLPVGLLLLCPPLLALDPSRQISQYAHTAWRVQDGAFSGTPHAITQTVDGYLWIGTEGGLLRFDGVRFVSWISSDGKQLPSRRIYSLLGASDGSLWIGTGIGLARSKNGESIDYSAAAPGFIEAILEDANGTVWMTRSQVGTDTRGPLCSIGGNDVHCHGEEAGIPFHYAQPLTRDDLGNLWIGSSLGVCRWTSGSTNTYLPPALKNAKGLSGVAAITAARDGTLWVGMRQTGADLGLQQLINGTWKSVAMPGLDGSKISVSALLMDREGGLWIGTENQGIYRVHDGKADHFGSADGLSSNSVNGFYEDHEGDLWAVTTRGIDRFHETRVESFSIREGMTGDEVGSVLTSRDGTVWIGNVGGLNRLRHGELSAVTARNGLPGRLVTSLLEDHSGRLWVGVDDGLTVYENGRFRAIHKPDGSPLGVVTAMTEDVEHNVWVEVTQPALFRIRDFQVREEIDPPKIPRTLSIDADPKGGIWLGLLNGNLAHYRQNVLEMFSPNHGRIRNLLVDADGSAWAATEQGAVRWNQGKLNILDSRNDLPCDSIFAVARDNMNSLWLDSECGMLQIDDTELEKWWQQPDAKVKVKTLDVFDGAQPALTNFRPEVSKSTDGKLYFANDDILQMIDPNHLAKNELPPPVHVEQVIADQKKYSPTAELQLPALTRNLEIDYTALSLVAPEKVHFRYKLEGHDTDWQDPGTRRQASYNDLRPGKYRFRVIASNNDGVWNDAGATLSFTVLPAFFQTAWFWTLCCISAAGVLWLMYSRRVRQLATEMQTRLEERLEEREAIARDLHDTLLQGFFSAAMQLDVANDCLPADSPAKPIVQRVIELMNQVGQEGRNTIRSLRSPLRGSHDLEQALSQIREEFPGAGNVDFSFVVEGMPRLLNPIVWDEVYRLGREAITNAFRHSGARKIEVEIEYAARYLRLIVRDDGCGIDEHMLQSGREGHWGLSGMRERAEKIRAKLLVLSRPGAGTEVQLSIPGRVAFETAPDRFSKWLSGLFQKKNEGKPSDTQ
jgi:signal transduction histidine kinase/ligand-binding sensor domain-containing protein